MVRLEPAELLLDADIRTYVLLPILIVMFSVSLIRHFVTMMFPATPSKNLKDAYDAQILLRSRRLMTNGARIPKVSFERRRAYLIAKEKGLLTVKALPPVDKPDTIMNLPTMDPSKMMAGQMSMIFNNLYIVMLYNTIEHFFSGFIAAKLPFSLTGGFKRMMHTGIDLENLEVTYVSSSSWYLLIFSGLNQVTSALLGPSAVPAQMGSMEAQLLPQMGAQGGMFGGASEPHKVFETEGKMVAGVGHVSAIEGTLGRLLHRYEHNEF